MSRLDELIRQFCPEGVPFQPLGELLNYEQPGAFLVASTAYDDSFPTPVLTAGKSFILGYSDEVSGIYPASPEQPVIIFDDFTTAFKWVDFPFKVKSSAMKMITAKPGVKLSLRFAWFAMQLISYEPREHARQWISKFSKYSIPVPPIEVQTEIVRVLNLFQALQAELEAEREARNFQYAHYRDSLLSFADRSDVSRVPMAEVGEFIRGRRFTRVDFAPAGIPSIHYGEIYTHYGVSATSTRSFVRDSLHVQLRYAQPGDVIIAAVGETVEDVAKPVAWLGKTPVAIHDDSYAYRSELDATFVSHVMRSRAFQVQKSQFVARGKVKRVSGDGLGRIVIPVPPLDEQVRVAGMLDKFDAMVNDLSMGLPAELAARRSQYEHYRDRLLAFDELGAMP